MTFILPAWFVRSIRFFRHPYRLCHLFDMSSVICVICHLWHKLQMTDETNDRWRSQYGCLKKRLDLTSQAGSMKLIANVFLNHKNWKYLGENYSFINIGNPLYFRVNFDVAWWTPKIAQIWTKSFGGVHSNIG